MVQLGFDNIILCARFNCSVATPIATCNVQCIIKLAQVKMCRKNMRQDREREREKETEANLKQLRHVKYCIPNGGGGSNRFIELSVLALVQMFVANNFFRCSFRCCL